jgi:hypothetical protein
MTHYWLHLFKLGHRTRKTIELDASGDDEAIGTVQQYIKGPAMLLCEGGEGRRRVARFPPRPPRAG